MSIKQEQLFEAVEKGYLAEVSTLLDSVDIIDSINEYKQTALHIAALNNQPEIIKFLISKGAKIDAKDENGWTPLYCAALEDKFACAEILLQNNANPNIASEDTGSTPLISAASNGNKSLIELLIATGAKVNTITKSGWTALHSAADHFAYEGGDYENIKLLLNHGAKSYKNNFGHTPKDIVASGTDESLSKIFDENSLEAPILGESNHI